MSHTDDRFTEFLIKDDGNEVITSYLHFAGR